MNTHYYPHSIPFLCVVGIMNMHIFNPCVHEELIGHPGYHIVVGGGCHSHPYPTIKTKTKMKKQRGKKQEKQIKNIYNNILLSLHTMEIHTERQQLLLPTQEMMMMERL